MIASFETEAVSAVLKRASRSGEIPKGPLEAQLAAAVEGNVITVDEAAAVKRAESLRDDAIQVDAFSLMDYLKTSDVPDSPDEA